MKTKLAVIMGGPSGEHDVSIDSGIGVVTNLDLAKYEITPIVIDQSGFWHVLPPYNQPLPKSIYKKLLENTFIESQTFDSLGGLIHLKNQGITTVFLALHGQFGEDGTIQGLLDSAGFTYNGSGVEASALAMNKAAANAIYQSIGLSVPSYLLVTKGERPVSKIIQSVDDRFGFPCIIKPSTSGSSIGISLVADRRNVAGALEAGFKYSQQVMIQQFIQGREITCGILDTGKKIVALPPTEIVSSADFFDYRAKYTPGAVKEITPAPLSKEATKAVQDIALTAHRILGCRDYSRTDIIMSNGDYYILETNNLPGMTDTSVLPQQAQAAGIRFTKLLDILINNATQRIDRNMTATSHFKEYTTIAS